MHAALQFGRSVGGLLFIATVCYMCCAILYRRPFVFKRALVVIHFG
jgi:hypothetical protein